MNIKRVWNGRFSGFPSACLMFIGVASRRLADLIVTLLWKGNLKNLGKRSIIQHGVVIRYPGRIKVGDDCSISKGSALTSEHSDGFLEIGSNVIVNKDVNIDFTGGVVIGNDAVISEGVMIYSHSHGHNPRSTSTKTPLVIGESTWVSANVVICEGVSYIASNTIVAAGAVVTREIRTPGLYGGTPARFIKKLDES